MNKLFVNLTRGRGLMFAAAPRPEAQVYFSMGFGFPGYYGYNPGYYYPYRYYYRPYAGYYYQPYYWYRGHRYYRHHYSYNYYRH